MDGKNNQKPASKAQPEAYGQKSKDQRIQELEKEVLDVKDRMKKDVNKLFRDEYLMNLEKKNKGLAETNTNLQRQLDFANDALPSQSSRIGDDVLSTERIAGLEKEICVDDRGREESSAASQLLDEIQAGPRARRTIINRRQRQSAKRIKGLKHKLKDANSTTGREEDRAKALSEKLSDLNAKTNKEIEGLKKDLADMKESKASEVWLRVKAEKDLSHVKEEKARDIETALAEERKNNTIVLDNLRAKKDKELAKANEENNIELATY
ncbi:uncharacterized protein PAC_05811 [Phialocephala subalpina]|uniref:Uncharacterized protein n=1 Tax=Phialocephala subalpina TaxID=576137 RepID=A0A1L7WT52_9HELO|nr:uncharacterized protein PAC_05811 [Phialocephala subalpina]